MKKIWTKTILLAVLVTALTIGAFAATSAQSISVNYNDIKLVVDGKTVTPTDANGNAVEPFIYNGTTYLPVRAVGEALGKTISWDGDTHTIYLGAVPGSTSYSRTNPAPIGTPQTIFISGYSNNYTATLQINSILRGSAAWTKIYAANKFNSKPTDGMEYILVNATITADSISNDSAVTASKYNFDTFSKDNVEYDTVSVVDPTPSFSGDIYTGASITGYFTVMVNQNDANPKIAYMRNYDGTGGIWFSLSK